MVLASACSMFWPTTAKVVNRQRNNHVEVYRYTVKCAYEDTRILAAHYGEYILHPVELPLQCFRLLFDCGSSNIQKQSVSNAFQYVAHRPRSSSLRQGIHSHQGQIAFAKLSNLFETTKKRLVFFLQEPRGQGQDRDSEHFKNGTIVC